MRYRAEVKRSSHLHLISRTGFWYQKLVEYHYNNVVPHLEVFIVYALHGIYYKIKPPCIHL